MATRNGARAMGRDDIGTIAAGNIADLIIVSESPLQDVKNLRHITHVMRAGKLHPIEELARPYTSGAIGSKARVRPGLRLSSL